MTVVVVVLTVPALLLLALLVVCVTARGWRGLGWFVLWCAGLALLAAAGWGIGIGFGDRGCDDESSADCIGGIILGYELVGLVFLAGPVVACVVETALARRRARVGTADS